MIMMRRRRRKKKKKKMMMITGRRRRMIMTTMLMTTMTPCRQDQCGQGLECKDNVGTGPICLCRFQETVCGSDGKTYSNLCQLMSSAVRLHLTNTLNVKRVGPCEPGQSVRS